MQLYPAIDLKDGKCVRLVQGNYNKVTIYSEKPSDIAKLWESQGATYLHLVDLDGAKSGSVVNEAAIRDIIEAISIPVEIGGGIRTLEAIENMLAMGVKRVILGSSAVRNRVFIEEAISKFGHEKIVVGVDTKGGRVAIEGWLEATDLSAIDFCQELQKLGVRTVIYTDIAKDGMLQGPNIQETRQLIEMTQLEIIASGGVASYDDLEQIASIQASGVIIGKALYTGTLSLQKALEQFERGR